MFKNKLHHAGCVEHKQRINTLINKKFKWTCEFCDFLKNLVIKNNELKIVFKQFSLRRKIRIIMTSCFSKRFFFYLLLIIIFVRTK